MEIEVRTGRFGTGTKFLVGRALILAREGRGDRVRVIVQSFGCGFLNGGGRVVVDVTAVVLLESNGLAMEALAYIGNRSFGFRY